MTGIDVLAPREEREWPALAAAVAAGLAGAMVFVLAPMFLAALRRDAMALSENQIGLIGSADPTGLFVGAAIGLVALHRVQRRRLALIALIAVAATNVLCILIKLDFAPLLSVRVLAGTAGGVVLAVAYAGMSATRVPERSYAIYLIAQTVVGAMLISTLSHFGGHADMRPIFVAAATLSLLATLAVPWLATGSEIVADVRAKAAIPRRLALLTAPAISMIGAACLAIWVNFEGYGDASGLSPGAVGTALSLGLVGAAAGSLLVALTGVHFGRLMPCLAMMAMLIVSATALLLPLGAVSFAIVAFTFQFGISACNYVFGRISVADGDGRMSVIYLLSLKAGFAVGPWLGSRLIIAGGLNMVVLGGVAALAIVTVLFTLILRTPLAADSQRPA